MFTGLIREKGLVLRTENLGSGKVLFVSLPGLAKSAQMGDSIAINGACLTVAALDGEVVRFEISPETLVKTTLGSCKSPQIINSEPSLRVGDNLGGHFVQGHIDGIGELLKREKGGGWETLWFSFPAILAPLIAPKGSISVDGISLTVVEIKENSFSVALIPHTLQSTNLGDMVPGTKVNLEGDLLARYLVRIKSLEA